MVNRFEITVPSHRFDIALCVSSGQVFRWQSIDDGHWLGVDGAHWYSVRLLGSRGSTGVKPPARSRASGGTAVLQAAEALPAYGVDPFSVESNALPADFESLFRLDWDAEAVEAEIARRAPELAPYMGMLAGLRLMRPSSPTEVFFCFLCTPNNNIRRITKMCGHLASYGPAMAEVHGRRLHRFPDFETVAGIAESELWSAGFGYRSRTIPSIARQALQRGGTSWLESLKAASYQEAHRELLGLNGIGPKLADCIALFALHHTESVPVDTHIWQAVTRLYLSELKGKPLTQQRYYAAASELRSRLGELAGWGHQYLFYENVLNWRSRK